MVVFLILTLLLVDNDNDGDNYLKKEKKIIYIHTHTHIHTVFFFPSALVTWAPTFSFCLKLHFSLPKCPQTYSTLSKWFLPPCL